MHKRQPHALRIDGQGEAGDMTCESDQNCSALHVINTASALLDLTAPSCLEQNALPEHIIEGVRATCSSNIAVHLRSTTSGCSVEAGGARGCSHFQGLARSRGRRTPGAGVCSSGPRSQRASRMSHAHLHRHGGRGPFPTVFLSSRLPTDRPPETNGKHSRQQSRLLAATHGQKLGGLPANVIPRSLQAKAVRIM